MCHLVRVRVPHWAVRLWFQSLWQWDPAAYNLETLPPPIEAETLPSVEEPDSLTGEGALVRQLGSDGLALHQVVAASQEHSSVKGAE